MTKETGADDARNTVSIRSRSPDFNISGGAIIGMQHCLKDQPQSHLGHATLETGHRTAQQPWARIHDEDGDHWRAVTEHLREQEATYIRAMSERGVRHEGDEPHA